MADEIFTHTFEIDFKEDGSQFMHGQVEFNVDGKVSFKIEETSIPLSRDAMHGFTELMTFLKTAFYDHGGIKKVEIVQKRLP